MTGPVLLIAFLAGMALPVLALVLRRNRKDRHGTAAEADRRERDRLKAIFEAVPDPLLVYDPEREQAVDFNAAVCDRFGYSPEEIHHLRLRVFFSGDSPYSVAEARPLLDAAQNGRPQTVEWETRTASGNPLSLEIHISRICPENRPLLCLLARDIRKTKQTEVRLNRFVNIIGQIGQGVATSDLNGTITYANQAWADMHGYALPTIVGKPLSLFHTESQVENEVAPFNKKVLRTGSHRGEVGHRRSDGSLFVAYMTSTLQKDDSGRVIGFICMATDLSEQKKVEEALRESEIKFRHLFNLSPQPISVTDLNGSVLDVNQKFCEKMQYSRREIIGRNVLDLGFPAEDRQRYMDLLLEKGEIAGFEILYKTKTNQAVQFQLYAKLVQIRDHFYILNVFHDITTQRQLESQLVQSQKMEAIGTLAGGIAHDFNNILSAILGYIELAKIYVEPENRVFQYLEEVFKAGTRARDLVRQILSISRQAEHKRKPVDMAAVIRDALAMLRVTLPAAIEIRDDIRDDTGLVEADPVQMHQVVMNLVTNAGQSMKAEGGILTVRLEPVEFRSEDPPKGLDMPPGPYVKLGVSDTGHGIRPEDRKRIFDPYYTTKDQGVGTGLGLAVVQSIVKKHGGAVMLSSEPGKGAHFYVYLPVVMTGDDAAETEATAVEDSLLPSGTERILLVDDEDSILETAKEMLEYLGYSVDACLRSPDAWELFQATPDRFDLVISDMTMPAMNGDELAGKMLALRPGLPVIICTGYNPKIDEAQARSLGLKAFIFKPLTFQKLAATVRKVLDGKV